MKNMSKDLWSRILKSIRGRVPEGTYDTWFSPLKPVQVSGSHVRAVAPNPLFIEWIHKHYEGLFAEVGRELNLPDLCVDLLDAPPDDLVLTSPPSGKARESKSASKRPADSSELAFNPLYRFEAFVEGPSNRFAYAACKAVAQSPSKAYNPLYVYGGVGLGKTHIMQSIGHFVRENFPALKVSYLSAERFMNEMISAIGNKSTPDFRGRYRYVDVLLLDDVQFLANKTGTQEELFHTFNALYDGGKQMVLPATARFPS